MPNSLKFNAYHILGLDTSATSKQILQRSNEIIQRLKIEDCPAYDLDIAAFGNVRTEESVKDATRRLQSPKLRMQEHFFWFEHSAQDPKPMALIVARDYVAAADYWKSAAVGDGDASFRCARHLALARSLSLLAGNNSGGLDASLDAWKAILESAAFWASFSKSYKFDENSASDEVVADFRKDAPALVSDIYVEIQETRGATDYVYEFQKSFSAKGERVEKDILNPAFRVIQLHIASLDAVDMAGTTFDAGKAAQVRQAITAIQSELNTLVDAGLFNDSATKIVRDRIANSIRRIVLDMHNNHRALAKSHRLLEVAAQIAGTDALKSMLAEELTQIQKNIDDEAASTLTLDIPGTLGGGKVALTNDCMTYDNRKILYKDATRISYHAVSRSVNFIPVSQTYHYMVASPQETIMFSFGTTLYIGNEQKKEVWARLAGVSKEVIEPHIVQKLVERIFSSGGAVRIGDVEFSRDGYHRSKMFGGQDEVSWTDTVYVPTFSSGNVILWKAKNGKSATFATVAMSTPNAVVMPELIKACVAEVQSHAKR